MESSHAIVVQSITTHVSFVRGRLPRPRYTPEGKSHRYAALDAKESAKHSACCTSSFVEMLESHHSLVVKALQTLYKFCINNEGFPGEPLAEAPDGHPLTHAILDRLGLIKQAEENADEPDEDSEDLRYLRLLSTSTECSATAEPSPEPATPPEPSRVPMSRPSVCSSIPTPLTGRNPPNWQWDMQPVQQPNYNYTDAGYQNMLSMPRSSISAADLASNDIPPHVEIAPISSVPHGHHQDQSYAYYFDSCSSTDSQDVKPVARMHTGIMPEHHTHTMGNLSSDMLGDFSFQTQESPFYPGFTPGWSFPSG